MLAPADLASLALQVRREHTSGWAAGRRRCLPAVAAALLIGFVQPAAPGPALPPAWQFNSPSTAPPDMQGRYLRAVAQDSYLWEAHCLARWPGAEAQLYVGDWCQLYCARSAQPAQLPQATDKVRALTAAAAQRAVEQQAQQQAAAASAASGGAQQTQRQRGEALAGLAFEEVMRCLFTVGLAVTRWAGGGARRKRGGGARS